MDGQLSFDDLKNMIENIVDTRSIGNLISGLWSMMTSNPLFSFYIGVGVVCALCWLFKMFRWTAH